MIRTLLAAAAALSLSTAVQAQDTLPAQGGPATDIGLLPGAQASADCGGLHGLAGKAFCVVAPLGQVGALAEAYISDLESKGWLSAGGDDNRVVFVKRRESGGCDGLQMIAFYDTSKVAVAETPGFLGFATIPGDVCAAPATPPAAAGTPPQ